MDFPNFLSFLPNEIIIEIIKLCDLASIVRFRECSHFTKNITDSMHLWQYLLKRDYAKIYICMINSYEINKLNKKWKEIYIATYKHYRAQYYKNHDAMGYFI